MSRTSSLFFSVGFLLGLRPALDADYLAAVSTGLAERPFMRASGFVGFGWGVGHTLTLMMVGAVVLVSGGQIQEPFAVLAESGVGLVLVVLGGMLAFKLFRERGHLHSHVHDGEPHVYLPSHRRHAHDRTDPKCAGHLFTDHWTAAFLRCKGLRVWGVSALGCGWYVARCSRLMDDNSRFSEASPDELRVRHFDGYVILRGLARSASRVVLD